jgi:hypothetical protein
MGVEVGESGLDIGDPLVEFAVPINIRNKSLFLLQIFLYHLGKEEGKIKG